MSPAVLLVAVLVALGAWMWWPGDRPMTAAPPLTWRRGVGRSGTDVGASPHPAGSSEQAAPPDLPAPSEHAAPLDLAVLLSLARAALAGGSSVPATLVALGECAGEASLVTAGRSLLLGASWEDAAQDVPARCEPLMHALAPAWTAGADPDPLLAHAAEVVRAGRRRATDVAAAALGVRLVLPLGLCFLPAFVALGMVPILVSFLGDLLGG